MDRQPPIWPTLVLLGIPAIVVAWPGATAHGERLVDTDYADDDSALDDDDSAWDVDEAAAEAALLAERMRAEIELPDHGVDLPSLLDELLIDEGAEECLDEDDGLDGAPRGIPMGSHSGGWLVEGIQFPDDDPRFHVIAPHRSYCSQVTIDAMRDAVDAVEALFPGTAALTVGDVSRRRGGRMSPHMSHQVGLDIDIGPYWAHGETEPYMPPMHPSRLDMPRTWALVEALVGDERVQYIILDYRLQGALYEYAAELPWMDDAYLEEIFQYPRGAGYHQGIIRHWPGHYGHFHVRFYCPDEFAETCRPTAP